jgi:beta-N-acetylhexosaminidase
VNERDLRRWIGQILMAGFPGQGADHQVRHLLVDHQVRNLILFGRNVASLEQVRALTCSLHELAATAGVEDALLIATDQENGIVRRLAPDLPGLPGNMALGATGRPALSRQVGFATGRLLRTLGIQVNLAPVLDVNNNPQNPVIDVRAFHEDPDQVAGFGVEMVRGLQAAGVAACGKHFPGHGDTAVDSHSALPWIPHELDRLRSVELKPFRASIAAGIDMLMTSHVVLPNVDPDGVPATVSRRVLTGLLRQELGFQGVVITDCLEMSAIVKTLGVGEGAVQALLAGADMVLVSHRLDRQEEAIQAIVRAVQKGRLPADRVQEAAARVRVLRCRAAGMCSTTSNGIIDIHRGDGESSASARFDACSGNRDEGANGGEIGFGDSKSDRGIHRFHGTSLAHLRQEAAHLQAEVCPKAVTIVRDRLEQLPFVLTRIHSVSVFLSPGAAPRMQAADTGPSDDLLTAALRKALPGHDIRCWHWKVDGGWMVAGGLGSGRVASAGGIVPDDGELKLIGLNGIQDEAFLKAVRRLCVRQGQVVLIALQSPYDIAAVPEADTVIAIYEHTPWMVQAGVAALFGGEAKGRLPITLPKT